MQPFKSALLLGQGRHIGHCQLGQQKTRERTKQTPANTAATLAHTHSLASETVLLSPSIQTLEQTRLSQHLTCSKLEGFQEFANQDVDGKRKMSIHLDPSVMADPNLGIRLASELQRRVGKLPIIRPHPFHLDSQPGVIIQLIQAEPHSFAEISRLVRAARTMKLTVRAHGDRSSGDQGIYGSPITVLVDCSRLSDSPRMELVKLRRRGELGEIQGLRVLAGVRIAELIDFQARLTLVLVPSSVVS
ncbi:unnamed protein product [Protopolystoma xenopodis]|uniref:Uncharacterized protein n=1 Tax=Protopolystoma xenopodis TaxID=117903 RepID=A0A3S5FCH1_9PLAT|nr:unnamed protein product [Protopolystoma xenopodis]